MVLKSYPIGNQLGCSTERGQSCSGMSNAHIFTTREKFSRSYASESNALAMVHDLPFSISNILRTDFPDPSRLSTKPRIFFAEPSRNQQYLNGMQNAHQKLSPAISEEAQKELEDRDDAFGICSTCCCWCCDIQREASICFLQKPTEEGKIL